MERVCFVTTGATAVFPELVDTILSEECLNVLAEEGFTKVNIQCGKTYSGYQVSDAVARSRLEIELFDFKADSLTADMRECQPIEGLRENGLIIMHGGGGTVMEGLRLGLSMIVVPNPSLLDNHQAELAQELQDQNYAIHSNTLDLIKSIRRASKKQSDPWTASHCTIKTIVDEVAGYSEDAIGAKYTALDSATPMSVKLPL